MIKALIITGDGVNCEKETAYAFELAQAQTKTVHIGDLLENPKLLQKFQLLAIPGGFSFGDDLGSGKILALKMKCYLADQLQEFKQKGKPIIGICNGFQVLAKLGLLEEEINERTFTLAQNDHGKFNNSWVGLSKVPNSNSIWLKNINDFELPMRHGEGRVAFRPGQELDSYNRFKENHQVALVYKNDVNGSYQKIAALSDPSGLILGIMPHPEAAIHHYLFPHQAISNDTRAPGLTIFDNGVNFVKDFL